MLLAEELEQRRPRLRRSRLPDRQKPDAPLLPLASCSEHRIGGGLAAQGILPLKVFPPRGLSTVSFLFGETTEQNMIYVYTTFRQSAFFVLPIVTCGRRCSAFLKLGEFVVCPQLRFGEFPYASREFKAQHCKARVPNPRTVACLNHNMPFNCTRLKSLACPRVS